MACFFDSGQARFFFQTLRLFFCLLRFDPFQHIGFKCLRLIWLHDTFRFQEFFHSGIFRSSAGFKTLRCALFCLRYFLFYGISTFYFVVFLIQQLLKFFIFLIEGIELIDPFCCTH